MECEDADPGSSGRFIYGRYSNPTVARTEQKLSEIFHALGELRAWATLTSSGMAAIDCVLSLLCPLRGHVANPSISGPLWPQDRPWLLHPSELYGGTLKYIRDVLKRQHGEVSVKEFSIKPDQVFSFPKLTDEFIAAIKDVKPAVVFFEPVTNPTLCVFDVRRVIEAAHSVSAAVVVDNTFTPFVICPLQLGADLVVHSVTKALSGHGTITAGLVCGRVPPTLDLADRCPPTSKSAPRSLDAAVRDWRKTIGCVLSPRDAFELTAQLETLELRIRAANANAQELSDLLSAPADRKIVSNVCYPGRTDHPNRDAVTNTFTDSVGHGSVVTIDLGTERALRQFMNALDVNGIECRLTLGDSRTTVLPIAEVFGRERFAGYHGSLRISVGIEPFAELEKAFKHSLSRL